MLTILSPCILPVLPFVFSVAFAGIATLAAAVGGSWAVRVNQYGRLFALVLLTAFAATLLSARLTDWFARPFVALGNRLSLPDATGAGRAGWVQSALLGVATGLLWAPCAGPILGLILTGAAISFVCASGCIKIESVGTGRLLDRVGSCCLEQRAR